MNNKIPCDVILDLLPLCAEGLSSDKSSDAVEEHIRSCPACQRVAENITKSTADGSAPCDHRDNERSVDYLKKIRSRSRRKIIIGVCSVICLALAAIVFKLYIYGSPTHSFIPKITSESVGESDTVYKITGTSPIRQSSAAGTKLYQPMTAAKKLWYMAAFRLPGTVHQSFQWSAL